MQKPLIHYISYDRFPAGKGAAVHIDAFTKGLQKAFGPLYLTTVKNTETNGPVPPVASFQSENDCRMELTQGIHHLGIPVFGKNVIQRVLSFRKSLQQNWIPAPIIHFRSIFEGYPIIKWAKESGHKIVYEVNGLPSIEMKYHYPAVADDRELLTKLRHQEEECLKAADLIITVSQVNAEHLLHKGADPKKVQVIPNGVDTELFHYKKPEPPTSELKALYVGTLSPWQGVRVALEAIALARRDIPASLTIIGDARNRQKKDLLKLAEKLEILPFVEIVPPQSQENLVPYYHRSNCVLAPLLSNDRNRIQGCCPLKVLEAMSCGPPLIASDMAVVRALSRNDQEAILVKPGNPKSIKDGMLRLYRDSSTAIRLSAAARRRVKTNFTWTIAQDKLISVYRSYFPNICQ